MNAGQLRALRDLDVWLTRRRFQQRAAKWFRLRAVLQCDRL